MTSLIYTYEGPTSTQQLKIELNDFDFTKRWIKYMEATAARVPRLFWYSTKQNFNNRILTKYETPINLCKLYKSFAIFHANLPYDVTEPLGMLDECLENPEKLNQHHLNVWHRWFTRLAGAYFQENITIPPSLTRDELYHAIHAVNGNVHVLEKYTYSDLQNRRSMEPTLQYSTQCHNAHNLSNLTNGVWAPGYTELLEPGGYDFRTQEYRFSVWLHEDIQGKDQMKAWLDHDDLNMEDITGNLIMTPNVTFDPNMTYARIIDNPEFRKQSDACGKTLDRYPLGNIINADEFKFEEILRSKVMSIELDGKELWGYTPLEEKIS